MKVLGEALKILVSTETLEKWPDDIELVDLNLPQQKKDVNPTIGVSNHLAPVDVLAEMINSSVPHLVHRMNTNFEAEVNIAAQMMTQPELYFEAPHALMLPGSSDEQCFDFTFSNEDEKDEVLKEYRNVVNGIPQAKLILERLLAIGEELANNAMHAVSSSAIQDPTIRLLLNYDQKNFAIACSDPAGQLDPLKVVQRIKDCYIESNEGSLDPVNRGIGAYLMFSMCSSFYLGVLKGRQSVVSCTMPMNLSVAERETLGKNIHLLIVD